MHINSKIHLKNKRNYETATQNTYFQTLEGVLSVAKFKKVVVQNLVEAFVKANISLKKVNALQLFLKKHCHESSIILQADALRWNYLPGIYQQHIDNLKEVFQNKSVSIIIDKTTNSRA